MARQLRHRSEAYQILSNPDSRAFYDKVGKAGMNKTEEGMVDPQEIFSQIFGGGEFCFSLFSSPADHQSVSTTMSVARGF